MTAIQVLNLQVQLKAALIVHKPNYCFLLYLQKPAFAFGIVTTVRSYNSESCGESAFNTSPILIRK